MSKQVRLVEIFHPDSEYSDWSPKSIFPSRNPLPLFVVNSKVNWPSIRQRWFVQWVCQSLEHWSQPMPMQCCSFLTIKVWKLVSSNRWKFSHVLFVHPGRLWEVLSSDSILNDSTHEEALKLRHLSSLAAKPDFMPPACFQQAWQLNECWNS